MSLSPVLFCIFCLYYLYFYFLDTIFNVFIFSITKYSNKIQVSDFIVLLSTNILYIHASSFSLEKYIHASSFYGIIYDNII